MEPFISASKIVSLIRDRKITCEEATRFFLQRIALLQPKLNAVCEMNPDAIATARRLDAQLNTPNSPVLPLHGLPISVKVNLPVKGLRCTFAMKKWKDHIATEDCSAVAYLRAAGCVILCTTTMPEMGQGIDSDSLLYGVTRNPYNLQRSAGGSSSGEGALIAAGGSPFGLGTDIGGSVRIPAHYNGCVALKPQNGRVPMGNPGAPLDWRNSTVSNMMRVIGPMARYIEDIQLVLPYMSGFDGIDPYCMAPAFKNEPVDLRKLRVAYYTGRENNHNFADEDTLTAINRCADALKNVAACVNHDNPGIFDAFEVYMGAICRDGGRAIYRQQAEISHAAAWNNKAAERFKCDGRSQWEKKLRALDHFRSRILHFLKKYDIILCPVGSTPAFVQGSDADQHRAMIHALVYSIAQVPAVSVGPIAFSKPGSECPGLPINVQVVGKPLDENSALAVAKYLQDTFNCTSHHPKEEPQSKL